MLASLIFPLRMLIYPGGYGGGPAQFMPGRTVAPFAGTPALRSHRRWECPLPVV